MNAQILYDRQAITPILFKAKTLGSKVDIIVAGHNGRISLPILGTYTKSKFASITAPKNYDVGVLHRIHEDDHIRWGRQLALPSGETAVENYLIEFMLAKTNKKARDQMTQIEPGLEAWFSLLRDWLEVLTHQDLSISEPPGGAQDEGNFMWSWKSKTIWRNITASGISLTMSAPEISRAASLAQWKKAINHANKTKIPPEEHLILRDARARIGRLQYKYSIIFSAVAAELTLKKQLEEVLRIRGKSNRLIKDIVGNTLGKIIDICEALSISVPGNVRDLNTIRNKAIHKNATLVREDAVKCLEVADKIIKTHSKL